MGGEHRACARTVAVESLVKTKFVPYETALEAVDRVFDRCYDDVEPYGRRSRSKTDIKMAHDELYLFGYN